MSYTLKVLKDISIDETIPVRERLLALKQIDDIQYRQAATLVKTQEVPAVSEVNKLRKDLKSAVKRIEELESCIRGARTVNDRIIEIISKIADKRLWDTYGNIDKPMTTYEYLKCKDLR